MAHNQIEISFQPSVARLIAKKSYAPEIGARAVRKTIQELVESRLAEELLRKNRKRVTVTVRNEKISL